MDLTYELSTALPNKWLNPDGSITDGQGNIITPATESGKAVYETSKSLVNKFVDTDGEIKTYAQISLALFIVVDELPEVGEKNRIYLVPSKTESGMFDEYYYNDNDLWDKMGEVTMDLSNYPTIEQMNKALNANSVADKAYTDTKIEENITKVLGGEY